ncbi:LamG-like jellyroll fold domain-containing protein [uncultured Amnibacterium sp.]|uniref:LamG-like jellyroll fold domain-containing protein n=1 Tax=uncultured Amnibacterium sp. TaxID=1631851 RepID=UPI0035C950AA
MQRSDRRRAGGLVFTASALLLLGGVAASVPSTLSAFTGSVTNTVDTAAAKNRFTCADVFAEPARRDTAFFEYGLRDEAGASAAADSGSAGNDGKYVGERGQDPDSPRACPADAGTPYRLDGKSSLVITSKPSRTIRQDFSIEIWFRTSAVSEKLVGFEDVQDGTASHYDKHLYIDSSGILDYGVYDGDTTTLTTRSPVNDGLWHQAVATTSSSDGSSLYLDGVQVAADPRKVLAEDYAGYWRIGQGRTEGWPGAPSTSSFTGSLAFAGAYATVLSPDDVGLAWTIGRPGPPADTKVAAPAPSSTAGAAPSEKAAPIATADPTTSPRSAGATRATAPAATSQPVSTAPGSDAVSSAQ